jgi:CheY-like chemotaxis protein
VVDDDLDVRDAMTDAVQSTGRHTVTARSGAEALALLADPAVFMRLWAS